jgi:hypothetical protein
LPTVNIKLSFDAAIIMIDYFQEGLGGEAVRDEDEAKERVAVEAHAFDAQRRLRPVPHVMTSTPDSPSSGPADDIVRNNGLISLSLYL